MNYSTAYNHKKRLMEVMDGLYMNARLCKIRHTELLEDMKKYVWHDEGLKRCPSWVGVSLNTHMNFLTKHLYKEWLRWAHEGSDDKLYLSFTDLSEEDQAKVKLDNYIGHYYWLEDTNNDIIERGSDGILTITKSKRLTKFYY